MSRRRPLNVDNPSDIHENLINDYIEGVFDDYAFLYRAVVVEVDHEGSKWTETEPVPNPRNSVKARIISRSVDSDTPIEDLPIFWPMFSHDIMPIKEGEHIFVIFEDPDELDHGLWLARIPEHNDVNSVNFVPGKKQYEENKDNDTSEIGIDQAVQDTDEPPDPIEPSEEFIVEDVDQFRARIGDRAIQGSNNTIIVLGRDRPDSLDSGEKAEAGTIDIVAGRAGPDDMNTTDDKSRIYISMKTDVDKNFATDSVGDSAGPSAAIGIKSDEIRVVARNGMKVVVEGGKINLQASEDITIKSDAKVIIDAPNINVGSEDSSEPLILGNVFVQEFTKFLTQLGTEAGGLGMAFGIPATVALPTTAAAATALSTALQNLLSKKHNTE